MDKVRVKHDTELETMQFKMNSSYGEFKKKRAVETEKLMLKHQNKFREIDRASKMDEKNFAEIAKGHLSKLIKIILNNRTQSF